MWQREGCCRSLESCRRGLGRRAQPCRMVLPGQWPGQGMDALVPLWMQCLLDRWRQRVVPGGTAHGAALADAQRLQGVAVCLLRASGTANVAAPHAFHQGICQVGGAGLSGP